MFVFTSNILFNQRRNVLITYQSLKRESFRIYVCFVRMKKVNLYYKGASLQPVLNFKSTCQNVFKVTLLLKLYTYSVHYIYETTNIPYRHTKGKIRDM